MYIYVATTWLIGLSLICSKFYPLFLPELLKILIHYSYFIPTSSPIIPTYSCNFYCIVDNNVHAQYTVSIIPVNRILPVQTFLLFFKIYIKYCYLHGHLHHHHHLNNLITFTHYNFQLAILVVISCECSELKLQLIVLKIMRLQAYFVNWYKNL